MDLFAEHMNGLGDITQVLRKRTLEGFAPSNRKIITASVANIRRATRQRSFKVLRELLP
jgi:hypothetical protein